MSRSPSSQRSLAGRRSATAARRPAGRTPHAGAYAAAARGGSPSAAVVAGARRYRSAIREILQTSDATAQIAAEQALTTILEQHRGRMPAWTGATLRTMPEMLEIWRAVAHISAERLPYLTGTPTAVLGHIARGTVPPKTGEAAWDAVLDQVAAALLEMCPESLRAWMSGARVPKAEAAYVRGIVVERCAGGLRGAYVRSMQERALLAWCTGWARRQGCANRTAVTESPKELGPGEFAIGKTIACQTPDGTTRRVRVDFAVRLPTPGAPLLLLDTRSAGDPTNMTKRIKEIAPIARRVRAQHRNTRFALVVGGFLSDANLKHMADERLPYAWHRNGADLEDLATATARSRR